jgi:hypothetical protein
MGDEAPNPASVAFQATFSWVLHFTGSPVSAEIPWLDGPRHCGQSSAANRTDKRKNAAQTTVWIPF